MFLHCEQFIKYEFRGSTLEDGFWVSHDSIEMTFWSGAPPEYHFYDTHLRSKVEEL